MRHLPGVETASYEVAEVAHTADALAEAFAGAAVVCNTVGPFIDLGPLQAYAAHQLVRGGAGATGFASACQVFGHRELLGVLRAFGLMAEPQLTGDVAPVPAAPQHATAGSRNGARAPLAV